MDESEQHPERVELPAQDDADLRSNDGGVDYPAAERLLNPLQPAVSPPSPENDLYDDTGERQRSAAEILCDSAAAEIPTRMSQLLVPESLEEQISWSKHLLSSLDATSSQDLAHQSNTGQYSSSIPIQSPAEHLSSLKMRSKHNGHSSQRDPVTPTRLEHSQYTHAVADSATSYRPSRTRGLLSEQASPIEVLQGRDREFMVRGQRHYQNSGPASISASSSRAPEAHLEDPLGHELVVLASTPVGASSSRAPKARLVQNRPNRLIEDQQGYDSYDSHSLHRPILTQTITWGIAPFEVLMRSTPTNSRPYTLPLIDEVTDEGAMVTRQHYFQRNIEVVGERSLESPSPQPRRRSPEIINTNICNWVQTLDASESQAIDTLHDVDHASISVSSPEPTPLSAADPNQGSSSTTNVLLRHSQAALRRYYKEDLLNIALAWPGCRNEARIKFLIKFNDKQDNYRQFADPDHHVHSDWKNYESYARTRRFRDSSKSFPVYGQFLFRDLDILKLWVNLNKHFDHTWPPGYTPQYPDANERDIRDEISSVGTEDQVSIVSE